MTANGKKCADTGLWIVNRKVTGYRVAKSTYGGLNPPVRSANTERSSWGRYDTTGSTVYLAESEDAAFHEVLAPFALDLQGNPALQKDADFLGMPLEDFLRELHKDWNENNYMNTGCLPAQWSAARDLYEIETQKPEPWIHIEHPETLAAIRRTLGPYLANKAGIRNLTLHEITSPEREVTTRIAEWARSLVLDDGRRPAGIIYTSKLGGRCYVYWLRGRDTGAGNDPIRIVSARRVSKQNNAFQTAAKRLQVTCF